MLPPGTGTKSTPSLSCSISSLPRTTSAIASALGTTQHEANASTSAFLEAARSMLGPSGLPDPAANQVALRFLESSVAAQANALAWRDGFIVLATVFFAAVIPAWLLANMRKT